MNDTCTIGERLRRLRRECSLTQEELAERAAVSVDLIKKLEQGTRTSARLTTLTRLAAALDVELAELIDNRPRLNGEDRPSVLALRDVLLAPEALPGIDPADDGGEPTPLPALEQAVRDGWTKYWSGNFVDLTRDLPALIGESRISERSLGVQVSQPLAQTYQLAACLMVHLGKDDLAAVSAERAIATALAGEDELQWATLLGTYSWVLLHQGRLAEAERLAARTAARVEPRLSSSPPQQLTVWGGLLLTAMAAAAAGSRADGAREYISLAHAGATRLDGERYDYQVSFGPTQVAMQATHAHAMLRRPQEALEFARGVRPADLPTVPTDGTCSTWPRPTTTRGTPGRRSPG